MFGIRKQRHGREVTVTSIAHTDGLYTLVSTAIGEDFLVDPKGEIHELSEEIPEFVREAIEPASLLPHEIAALSGSRMQAAIQRWS